VSGVSVLMLLVLMLLVLMLLVLVVVVLLVPKHHRILFCCRPLLLRVVLPGRLLVVVVCS